MTKAVKRITQEKGDGRKKAFRFEGEALLEVTGLDGLTKVPSTLSSVTAP